jgi:hypothetical protein
MYAVRPSQTTGWRGVARICHHRSVAARKAAETIAKE